MRAPLLLLIYTCLTGCTAIAVGTGSAATAILYDQRSIKTIAQDQNIMHRGYNAFKDQATLQNTRINITAINHRVLLTGQVQNHAQKRLAEKILHRTPNVKVVLNDLQITQKISDQHQALDAVITTKIKTQLLTEPHLQSIPMKIITENKVVYLMGVVSKKEARKAIRIAQEVRGVRHVVNAFEIIEK